jgi:hypothetical protein
MTASGTGTQATGAEQCAFVIDLGWAEIGGWRLVNGDGFVQKGKTMRRRTQRTFGDGGRILLERLEGRELFSVFISIGGGMTVGNGGGLTITVGNPAPPVAAPQAQVNTPLGVVAVANQKFIAAVARVSGVPPVASFYRQFGVITWGDGTTSLGGLFADVNGSVAILGAHTYTTTGNFPITMRLLAIPPAGSGQPILTLATTQSNAQVVSSPGSASFNPRAGGSFTARIGTLTTTFSPNQMSSNINWGDGGGSTVSFVPLSRSGNMTTYALVGTHTYNFTRSFVVRIQILQPTGRIVTILSAANVIPSSIT